MTETPTVDVDLSLEEMLRVMDVARTLRKEQETVEREFNREETRALLRKRMLETTAITGARLTETEVDAALDDYFDNLHTFQPPPPGLAMFLAHLWVLRRPILSFGSLLVVMCLLGWWLFVAKSGPFSPAGRTSRGVSAAMESIAKHERSIHALTDDADVLSDAERLRREADAARVSQDVARLQQISQSLASLDARLQEDYEVRVVTGDGRASAFEGIMTDDSGSREAGFYVIVEARTADGTVLPRLIDDAESNSQQRVSVWAERVPQAVYERLKTDKQADGILDETLFAVKKRGQREETIVIPDAGGQPIQRGIQMTEWDE